MTNERRFLICDLCGNQVGLMADGGGELVCCGQPMRELVPNTQEAATEKHIPSVTREEGRIRVQVGETLHPATEEHHIEWIAVGQAGTTQRVVIAVGEPPIATFCADAGPLIVYAYCNLHGLWMASVA